MILISRREFLSESAGAASVVATLCNPVARAADRKFKLALSPGAVGVQGQYPEIVDLAARHGFEAVEPNGGFLASLPSDEIARFSDGVRAKGLEWAAAGLPVEFRQSEARFEEGMAALRNVAQALQRAGVTRMTTWIMPCHESLTYLQNLRLHVKRLSGVASLLADHGLRLGLEYVGTPSLRNSRKYPFVHTMAETADLIAETGKNNLGYVLDSWHWWTAGDSAAELRALRNEQIVSVDLNDAPRGIPLDRQVDGQRELPASTGVIDTAAFLDALLAVGYDGPVRSEPFNRALNDLDNEAACASVIAAMRKALDRR